MGLLNVFDKNDLGSFVESPFQARNLESEEMVRVWGWRYRHICHTLRDFSAINGSYPAAYITTRQWWQDSYVASGVYDSAGGETVIRELWQNIITTMLAYRESDLTYPLYHWYGSDGFIKNEASPRTDIKYGVLPENLVYKFFQGGSYISNYSYCKLLEHLNLGGIDPITGRREWSKCNSDNTIYYTPYMSGKTFTICQSTSYKTQPVGPPILMTNGEIVFQELEACLDYLKKTVSPAANSGYSSYYPLIIETDLDADANGVGYSTYCAADPNRCCNHSAELTWQQLSHYTHDDGAGYRMYQSRFQNVLNINLNVEWMGWQGHCQYTLASTLWHNSIRTSSYYDIYQNNILYIWLNDAYAEFLTSLDYQYTHGYGWSSTTNYALGNTCWGIVGSRYHTYTSLQNNNLNHALTDGAWWTDSGEISTYLDNYENREFIRFPNSKKGSYISLTNGWVETTSNLIKLVSSKEDDRFGPMPSVLPVSGHSSIRSFTVADWVTFREFTFKSKIALGYKDMYHPKCPFCNRPYLICNAISLSRVYGQGYTADELKDMIVPVTNNNAGSTANINVYTTKSGNFNVTPLGAAAFNTPTFNLHYEILDVLNQDTLPNSKTYQCYIADTGDKSDTKSTYLDCRLYMAITWSAISHACPPVYPSYGVELNWNISQNYANPRPNVQIVFRSSAGRLKWSMGTPTWTGGTFGHFDKASDDQPYNGGAFVYSYLNLILDDNTFTTQKSVSFRVDYVGGGMGSNNYNYCNINIVFQAKP